MKKICAFMLMLWMLMCCTLASADVISTAEPTYEKAAAVRWVMDNATVDLSYKQALKIVNHVYANADKHDLDPTLLLAMMRTESGFNERAKSPVGAKGLMQVLPRWHKDKLKGRSPFNAEVSIEVGATIFKDCLDSRKGNVRKSLYCYLGGAQAAYSSKVLGYKKDIQRSIIYDLFKPDYTLLAMR